MIHLKILGISDNFSMNNVQNKIINFLGRALAWLFGIFFLLGGLFSLSAHPIGSLVIALGGLVMLPPIYKVIARKLNGKIQNYAIAFAGFFLAMVGMANTPIENPSSQPNNPQSLVTTQTAQPTAAEPQPKQKAPKLTAPIAVSPQLTVQTSQSNHPIQANYDMNCKVVGISDGDTFTCLTDDKQQLKIRMNQIDAPEKNQDFGQASKQALSGMIFGKVVGLKTNGTDKYGRTIAEAFYDGKNINKAMVKQGMAWAYREYMTDNEYADLETTARSSTTGLWSQPDPVYPSDYRRMGRGQTAPMQTQQITTTVAPTVSENGASCGSKRYCKQMATCAEAKHYLNECGVSRLDRDGDGVPCESLCQ